VAAEQVEDPAELPVGIGVDAQRDCVAQHRGEELTADGRGGALTRPLDERHPVRTTAGSPLMRCSPLAGIAGDQSRTVTWQPGRARERDWWAAQPTASTPANSSGRWVSR
jgi:hypothetical protein